MVLKDVNDTPRKVPSALFFITTETKHARGQLCFKLSENPVNLSFSTCLNTENPTKMEWEWRKMPFPVCFTFLLTAAAALSAAHYNPHNGVKRSGEAASNTTSHAAFLRGLSLTTEKAL